MPYKDPEARRAYQRKLYEVNREQKKEKQLEWRKANPELAKKCDTIGNWKVGGIVHEDYNALYAEYKASTNCEECGIPYGEYGDGSGTFKCCDHDHTTGKFRNFLCNRCNIQRK